MSPRPERPGSPRARLFVALDPPDDVRDELARWRDDAISGRDDLRPVAPEALHATLVFLGYRPEKEIDRIGELIGQAVGGHAAPLLAARAVKPLPPRRPRLFALDLDDAGGEAVALQASLSDALEAERIYKPEKRPFWPHITLARVKRNAIAAPWDGPPPPGADWRAAAVTLYRSTLRPQGALYEPLSRNFLLTTRLR
ncbi:MAG: RNA 2',3'-cyclic phosphodiesterase [Thermoleophilaceae bacterium]